MRNTPYPLPHDSLGDGAPVPAQGAGGAVVVAKERELLAALRAGDEAAFVALVERHHLALLRLARIYVHDSAVAEEVVQDTWIAVLRGLDRFEARSSLKTWIFQILINRARTIAQREGRTIPFSAVWERADEPEEPAVAPERFMAYDSPERPAGWWASPPTSWGESPERTVLAAETRACVAAAIADLPPSQREVITLRDIEGFSSGEVCEVLEVSEGNQRVLLHRARSKVRQALERYLTRE